MISQYHRPETIDQALQLLARKTPKTIPLGGGTRISQYRGEPIEVVDIQNLRLEQLVADGDTFTIGAGVRLADLEGWHELPAVYRNALRKEGTINLRQSATVGGAVVGADGTSVFACALLAADASLTWLPGETAVSYGDWLSLKNGGLLINEIRVPALVDVRQESVSRSPMDVAFLSISLARWKSGRVRVVLGGTMTAPMIIADGSGTEGIEEGLRSASRQFADHWAGADFRAETAVTLLRRMLADG